MSRAGRSDPCFGSKTHSNEKFADRMFVGKEKARRVAPRNKQLPSSNLFSCLVESICLILCAATGCRLEVE